MQKYILLTAVLFAVFTSAFSQGIENSLQHSEYKYIFKLTNENADSLIRDGFNDNMLHSLVDSCLYDSIYHNTEKGHYLTVWAEKGEMIIDYWFNNNISLYCFDNQSNLLLQILDSSGVSIKNAQISVAGKEIPFDDEMGLYYKKKFKKEGLLTIRYNNHISFYDLKRKGFEHMWYVPKWRVIFRKPLGYITVPFKNYIYTPIKNTVCLPYDTYKGIENGYFNRGWYKFINRQIRYTESLFHGRPQGLAKNIYCLFKPGYCNSNLTASIILNKPQYKQGDTLLYKLYLWKKGKPWSPKNMDIYVGRYSYYSIDSPKKAGTISPYKKGLYHGSIVLHDSILSQRTKLYTIQFEKKGRNVKSEGFYIEHYELQSNSFSVDGVSSQYEQGDSVVFEITATDANNFPLLDATSHIQLRHNYYHTSDTHLLYIPNTVWEKKVQLSQTGKTTVSIPADVFIQGSNSYSLLFDHRTSDNELHKSQRSFDYNNMPKNEIEITIDTKSIYFKHIKGEESTNGKAQVKRYLYEYPTQSDSITLPYSETLRADVYRYEITLTDSKKTKSLNIPASSSKIECFGKLKGKAVQFTFENSRNIDITYQLFANHKLIGKGLVNKDTTFTQKSKKHTFYTIKYQYIWGGLKYSKEFTVEPIKKQLQIQIDTIKNFYPGGEAEIELTITNRKNKAVKNADILAYGVNNKFKNIPEPQIPQQKQKTPYAKEEVSYTASPHTEIKKDIYGDQYISVEKQKDEMGLKENEYYNFLFPKESIFQASIDVGDSTTQFAPFVMKDGKPLPIYIIYKNYIPVYFGNTEIDIPYSFRSDSVIKDLIIRIPDGDILLKNIKLEKGKKNIISLDYDKFKKTNKNFIEKTYKLTNDEIDIIKYYSIEVDFSSITSQLSYLKQGDNIIRLKLPNNQAYYGTKTVGPVLEKETLFRNYNSYKYSFFLEAGYRHTFYYQYLKVKQIQSPDPQHSDFGIPDYINLKQRVANEDDIKNEWVNQQKRKQTEELFYYDTSKQNERTGKNNRIDYRLPQQLRDSLKYILLLRKFGQPELLLARETNLTNLTEDEYNLTFILQNNTYFESNPVLVKNFHKTVIDYSQSPVSLKNNVALLLKKYIIEKVTYSHEEQNASSAFIPSTNNNQSRQNHYTYIDNERYCREGRKITGTITDAEGPVIQATVLIKGTTHGTVTDFDGRYSICVPDEKAVLVFSYVGMKTIEKPVKGKIRIDVYMGADSKALADVVVVGYSVQRREKTYFPSMSGANQMEMPNQPTQQSIEGLYKRIQNSSNRISTRTYFSDSGFWLPNLKSDNKGKVSVKAKLPGNITAWKTFFVTKSGKKIQNSQTTINSYLPLSAEIKTPQFLVEGDSSNIITKTKNYLNSAINLKSSIDINDSIYVSKNRSIDKIIIDTVGFVAHSDTVSITHTIATEDNYKDGEKRSIPVFKKGTEETIGSFYVLESDTSFTLSFDTTLSPVTLYAESDEINIILRETEHVHKYQYYCNEQLASKLKCLIAQKRICESAGIAFKYDENCKYIIKKLLKARNEENLWGWWPNTQTHHRFSHHIFEALFMAKKEGYEVPLHEMHTIIAFLHTKLHLYTGEALIDRLDLLEILEAGTDFETHIKRLEADTNLSVNFYHYLKLMHLKQKLNMKVSVDTLLKTKKEHIIYGTHWGNKRYWLYNNSVMNTAMAYRILKTDGNYNKMLKDIRRYFIHERKNGHWQNTLQSSDVITTILSDILKERGGIRPNKLIIKTNGINTVTKFPYQTTISNSEATIEKRGNLPLYLTIYQKRWNDNPQKVSGNFEVTSFFKNGDNLKAGTPATLTIQVEAKKESDYVMVEVPIPAGCSYANKAFGFGETYREYKKNKVCIFITKMNAGIHYFTIDLLPRYTGRYSLLPSKAELMYFPVFYGRNDIRNIVIE